MSKNKKIEIEKQIIEENNLFTIPESIIPDDKRIFIPTALNKPPKTKVVISFKGVKFLTTGNLSSIISKAGVGKSSILECIIASYLNPKCDALGFGVDLYGYRKKILFIDGERTRDDTWNSWERIMKRAGKDINEEVPLIFANFKAIGIEKRIEYVSSILTENNDIGLVILDGGGDFVADVNSISETTSFKNWIYSFNPLISTLVSIHTNPRDEKPRGTTGSELLRISEGVLLARKLPEGTREITSQFEYGKIRNDNDKVSSYYQWEEEEEMFMSCDYVPDNKPKKEAKEKDVAFINIAFESQQPLTYTEIVRKYIGINRCKEDSARKYIQRNILPLLDKENDTYSNQGTF